MKKEDISCDNCGMDYILSYDPEEVSDKPTRCPFCGEVANPADLDEEWNDISDIDDWE